MQWKEKESRENLLGVLKNLQISWLIIRTSTISQCLNISCRKIHQLYFSSLPCSLLYLFCAILCNFYSKTELLYLSLTLQKLPIKLLINLGQGYLVYQLSEVRECLFLWVSTVFNKKRPIFHRPIFCDQNTNKPFAGFYPRHSFFPSLCIWISPSIG